MSSDEVTRRTFVKGLAVGGAVAAFGRWDLPAWAQPVRQAPAVLTGTEIDLAIGETPMNHRRTSRRRQSTARPAYRRLRGATRSRCV
jgi:FtsP/CotA-like multicopper oxidase with cupredoxin domain